MANIRPIISVSIVTYYPDVPLFVRALSSLLASFDKSVLSVNANARLQLILINNGGGLDPVTYASADQHENVDLHVLFGHGNVGYGAGHNLALTYLKSEFHLILNPDVELESDAIAIALAFFYTHADVGLIAPLVRGDSGEIEYLCRRYPSIFTLLLRGFFPSYYNGKFKNYLTSYELRDQIDATGRLVDKGKEFLEPPIISGCFMFYRTSVLTGINGFDPRYFLYFEDYDLSLRTAKVARIAYVPDVKIIHSGGGAAKKGHAHIKMFVSSAFRFFARFGWKLF